MSETKTSQNDAGTVYAFEVQLFLQCYDMCINLWVFK